MVELFATFALSHWLGDFPLQTDWLFSLKTRHWTGLVLHSAIHVLVTALLLRDPWDYWQILFSLGLIHTAFDWLKLRWNFASQTGGFVVDQAAHMVVLLMLAAWPVKMVAALTGRFTIPAALLGLAPAALMGLAVYSAELDKAKRGRRWLPPTPVLLRLSKLTGWPLLIVVAIIRYTLGS